MNVQERIQDACLKRIWNLAVGSPADGALDGSLDVDASDDDSDDDSDDSGISAFCQSSPSSTITAIMEPIFTFLEFSAFWVKIHDSKIYYTYLVPLSLSDLNLHHNLSINIV